MNYFKPASTLEQLPRRQKFSNHFWNFSCIFSINHSLVNTVKTSITKLAKRCDELIFPNKFHLCLYWYMNNTCSSISLRYTLRMEGWDIFWVTPLSAFEHAPSYDLFSFPMNFLLIFFFKGDNWRIKSMRWNKHVFRWKTKAHLLTVISKRKKFVCCKNAHENSLGVTGECYAQYKMRSVIRGESPWKTMARKRSSGIVTSSNNWFWNFPLWNKYRLWSSYFFYNHSIKAFAFVLDWPKLGWIVRRKRRRRILMTRYNFVYILEL